MIDKERFLGEWQLSFGKLPPISYMFKRMLPERWVRFHSLPESKRYAETPDEWKILIDRHFAILQCVIDTSAAYSIVANSISSRRWKPILGPTVRLGSFLDDDADNQDYPVHAYLCPQLESTAEMTGIFKLVADDKLRLFFVQSDRIFAPYDGGIDAILDTPEAASSLKSKFSEWLSKEPSGL